MLISESEDSSSSGEEEVSYIHYADDITFYDRGNGNCHASGTFVDPDIRSITVPETSLSGKKVTSIGSFDHLNHLEKVVLPKTLKEISYNTFLEDGLLRNILLPDGLTTISEFAFSGCKSLFDVHLPDSFTTFGMSAFSECTGIESISIPGSVKVLPNSLFLRCSSLRDVYLSEGIESIEKASFSMTGLERIFIPKSVKRISSGAFSDYPNKKITIYVEAEFHPTSWELEADDGRYTFIYGVKRSDIIDG